MNGEGASTFQPTRWTLVRRAQGNSSEARAALSELCEAYYQPVYQFLRARRRNEDEARELTQDFFARLLAKANVSGADPNRGKFRSFLLGAVKHFLGDLRDRDEALKRGGDIAHVPLCETEDSVDEPVQPESEGSADAAFDRLWAMALLARGVQVVEKELQDAGKPALFEVLKPWLTGESAALSSADAAQKLHMTEGAVKVAVHRLRQRFRAAVRAEIAQTVDGEAAVAAEMSYLVEVLSR